MTAELRNEEHPVAQYFRAWTRRKTRRIVCTFFLLLIFLMVAIAINYSATAVRQIYNNISDKNEIKMKQQLLLPLCVGNLLDKRKYCSISDEKSKRDAISLMLTSLKNTGDDIEKTENHCRLMSYTARPIVTCLDTLFHHHAVNNWNTSKLLPGDELIFVFIGDSRIRQQFINFVKIIPNFDQMTLPKTAIPDKYHGDIEVTSKILRLRVSFKWRPLVNDHLMDTLDRITKEAGFNARRRPYFILLSMAAWHMLREHGADIFLYQQRLTQLRLILANMLTSSSVGRIIWLRQYTTVDFYGDNGKSNTLVVSEKIEHYNAAALQRLMIKPGESNHDKGIVLWDSSDLYANEYARSCTILKRYEHLSFNKKEYTTAYTNCNDYIHTGYSALSQATQIFFNELCNGHIHSSD